MKKIVLPENHAVIELEDKEDLLKICFDMKLFCFELPGEYATFLGQDYVCCKK